MGSKVPFTPFESWELNGPFYVTRETFTQTIATWNYSDILRRSRIADLDTFSYTFFYTMKEDKNQKGFDYNMLDMKDTRPVYPSEKHTFGINELKSSDKVIHGLSISFKRSESFDINIMLEDSKRNYIGDIEFFNISKRVKSRKSRTFNNNIVQKIPQFCTQKSLSQ